MTTNLWPQIIIATSTLLAASLGYALAGLNEARRDRRAVEREKLARAEERHSAALRDRHQFQLETLLSLQDALQLRARLTGRTMHLDHMQAREGQYTQLPSGHDDEILANGFDIIRLRNRLLDEHLRDTIERFHSASSNSMLPPIDYQGLNGEALESAANLRSSKFGDEYALAMDHLGEALRAKLGWLPDADR